jgi:hypothetical protein
MLTRGASNRASVGFSELHEGDSAGDFIMRADSDLLARRNGELVPTQRCRWRLARRDTDVLADRAKKLVPRLRGVWGSARPERSRATAPKSLREGETARASEVCGSRDVYGLRVFARQRESFRLDRDLTEYGTG